MSGGQDEAAEMINEGLPTYQPEYQRLRRERIAVAAMQGLLANPDNAACKAETISWWAIEQADELIKQLDNPAMGRC